MTAVIRGFRTREELSLRTPRSFSRNVSPEDGGVALHWGGAAVPNDTQDQSEQTWRNWQNYHMDIHRWTDIAYTAGYTNQGYILAGRGFGVRTAAQGTNDGNDRYLAFTWVGGDGQTPSQDALNALEWLIVSARRLGAGLDVVPHRQFTGSQCPGAVLIAQSLSWDGRPINTPEPEEEDMWTIVNERHTGRLWAMGGTVVKVADPNMIRQMQAAGLVRNESPWPPLDRYIIDRLGGFEGE